MDTQRILNTYQSHSVETLTPGKLILMLYDGAIRFMDLAQAGFEIEGFRERNESIHNNLTKAQRILSELNAILDFSANAEFCEHISHPDQQWQRDRHGD